MKSLCWSETGDDGGPLQTPERKEKGGESMAMRASGFVRKCFI